MCATRSTTWPDAAFGTVIQGGVFLTNPLVAQSLNIVTLGANWYFNQNALKLTLDGGWAMNPVRFSQGLYGQSLSGCDWRASQTGKGTGAVVVRCQLQLLF